MQYKHTVLSVLKLTVYNEAGDIMAQMTYHNDKASHVVSNLKHSDNVYITTRGQSSQNESEWFTVYKMVNRWSIHTSEYYVNGLYQTNHARA
jgi:hypothetical protein